MKTLWLKYSALSIGAQLLLFLVVISIVGISGHDSLLVPLMFLYAPTIMLVAALGKFTGESGMILPILYGIPLGFLLYGIVIGRILSYLKARRRLASKETGP
jgi:hypothetical protein